MKPLNEKERTSAFLQFLLLYVFTVTITIIFVSAHHRVKYKDYEVLKKKAADIDNKEKYFADLTLLADSINYEINQLSKLDDAEFKVRSYRINSLLTKLESDNAEDAKYTNPLKKSIRKTSEDWITDQIRLRQIEVLDKEIIKKDNNIKRLRDFLEKQGFKKSDVDMLLEE